MRKYVIRANPAQWGPKPLYYQKMGWVFKPEQARLYRLKRLAALRCARMNNQARLPGPRGGKRRGPLVVLFIVEAVEVS